MSERLLEGKFLTELVLEVFRVNGLLLAAGNRLGEPLQLTSARWQVMGAIHLSGRSLTVAQIARRMGLTRQAVQRIVNDLAGLDMVKLVDNPDHKRAHLIALTDHGQQSYAAIDQSQIDWINGLANGLEKTQITEAIKLLKGLSLQLEQAQENS
ncbi:MAG: MarR family transcriptional regulator [Immundisolibacteraceae bacterium]|nr:MarR family transcriptional regulator [Immundisolibacteraceae bacterium]